jgi:hypothetical protein
LKEAASQYRNRRRKRKVIPVKDLGISNEKQCSEMARNQKSMIETPIMSCSSIVGIATGYGLDN